ncbi:hypothetical protein [Williamsia sterculiae]|uniref:Serine/threonine protein kinase n=1 Tax=Williamsia sterculiae TaxID=1344003 RepID=A0A1N7DY17_9NOCA|nr:hypothetical protein [Williamsia sterculiae]SIR80565.1 hypothetical protein SAMN05445060_0998 [Williamsia sterculiae]
MTRPQNDRRSPWTSPLVAAAAVVGLVVLALAVVLGLLFIPRHDDHGDTASASATAATGGTLPPIVTTTAPGKTVTVTPVLPTIPASGAPTRRPSPDVSNTDGSGFLDGGPRCNTVTDGVVMVARTARSRIVICQVGVAGGLYYKGLADGGSVEIEFPARTATGFTAQNNGVTYDISPATLVISEAGSVLAVEPMLEYWSS